MKASVGVLSKVDASDINLNWVSASLNNEPDRPKSVLSRQVAE